MNKLNATQTGSEETDNGFVELLVSRSLINEILHWYKEKYFLVKDSIFRGEELISVIAFSDYPFISGIMPFVSANLINLAFDQCIIIHIGLMIKYGIIELEMIDNLGGVRFMELSDYNKIVGDQFVTARIESKYSKPIPPDNIVEVKCIYLAKKQLESGRYILKFGIRCEEFCTAEVTVIYPLN